METESASSPPNPTFNTVSPAGMLGSYLANRRRVDVDKFDFSAIKISLLEGTKHGALLLVKDNTGPYYIYNPVKNYEGKDRAVFMAEFEGKRYRIVIDLRVSKFVNEKGEPVCPDPKLIKVNKPQAGVGIGGISVGIADMPDMRRTLTVNQQTTLMHLTGYFPMPYTPNALVAPLR